LSSHPHATAYGGGFGVPVYAAFKARRHPLVPAAFGAYVAYLVHAGVDWDWEMTAVTLTALFIGASIVAAERSPVAAELPDSPASGDLEEATANG